MSESVSDAAQLAGQYQGRPCERCGATIPEARVVVFPEARLCAECSRNLGGEFEVKIREENLSKENSLKKNYGSYGVKKVRRKLPPFRG